MEIKDVILRILLVSKPEQTETLSLFEKLLKENEGVWKKDDILEEHAPATVSIKAGKVVDYEALFEEASFSFSECKDKVQLWAVPDRFRAIVYLCRYKFDMIIFDCNESNEYLDFLSFLSEKHESNPDEYKLCRGVLNNRGPLNRLWIILCSDDVNGVFGDLQEKDISLNHSRWYIEIAPGLSGKTGEASTAAAAVARRIDLFIKMQVKGCVYELNDLMNFLLYSGQHLEKMYSRANNEVPKCGFHEFQDFMGAEFSTFLRHYGSRNVIRRDAIIDGNKNKDQKSVFATWVWNNFYNIVEKEEEAKKKEEKEKKKLFSLYNLMLSFYQVAASMPEDRNGVMRLRESFRRLRYFIDINIDVNKYLPKNSDDFEDIMNYFNDAIDSLLCSYLNHTTI